MAMPTEYWREMFREEVYERTHDLWEQLKKRESAVLGHHPNYALPLETQAWLETQIHIRFTNLELVLAQEYAESLWYRYKWQLTKETIQLKVQKIAASLLCLEPPSEKNQKEALVLYRYLFIFINTIRNARYG